MLSIKTNSTSELEIKKSKFLGFLYRVDNEDQVEKYIEQIKHQHKEAKHIVYAYKIYPNIIKKENSSEPAGTAAAPILSAIEKQGVSNVLLVVVRYFGGILLGASNLLRAYSSVAVMCLDSCTKINLEQYKIYTAEISYKEYDIFESIIGADKIISKEYGSIIKVKFACSDANILNNYNVRKHEGKIWL